MLQSEIEGSTFVDGFAGSGSVGIEALSRGATKAYFFESNRKTLAVLESNLTTLVQDSQWRIFSVPLPKGLELLKTIDDSINIIFFDPPYDFPNYSELLETCATLFSDALIILETSSRSHWGVPPSLKLHKSRKIGETALNFYGKSTP